MVIRPKQGPGAGWNPADDALVVVANGHHSENLPLAVPRSGQAIEAFVIERSRVLMIALTLEDEAVQVDDLWWAAHFAERASLAAEAAWNAILGNRHG